MIRLEIFTKKAHRLAALVIAAGIACSGGAKQAAAATITETFDSDPGWNAVNNTSGNNNFGFSNSNNVGAAAGEAGGVFDRMTSVGSAYYAASTAGLNGTTALQATGRYGWDERAGITARDNGEWSIGWFDSNYDPATRQHPINGVVFGYNSRNHFLALLTPTTATNGGRAQVDVLPDPKVPSIDGCILNESTTCSGPLGGKNFDLQYDPSGNGGLGVITLAITTDDATWNSAHSYTGTFNLTAAQRAAFDLASLDRFGILNRNDILPQFWTVDRQTRMWIDDVTYEAGTVPEPSAIVLLGLGAVLVLATRKCMPRR